MLLSAAEAFLRMAWADLANATAREGADPARLREAVWGFRLQQAAEKGLKAWLFQLDVVPPRRHDLARLLPLLQGAGVDVAPFSPLDQLMEAGRGGFSGGGLSDPRQRITSVVA